MASADLVIWIGPGLETFLAKPIDTLARPGAVMAVADLPGLTLLPRRRGEGWAAGHDREDGEDAEHGRLDLHLWLDPQNAMLIVSAIADRLAAMDPARDQRYRENEKAARARILQIDDALRWKLEPVRGMPFLVFHDAYQYLEHRYGMTAVGAVAIDPERPPGARHLAELRRRIAGTGARCVFAEPQFKPDLVETLREGTPVRAGVLDPLGADLPPGPGHYEALMRALGESLRTCLAG